MNTSMNTHEDLCRVYISTMNTYEHLMNTLITSVHKLLIDIYTYFLFMNTMNSFT